MGKSYGKIAVVAGGRAGMGLAAAKLFVAERATVVITGRDKGALDAAAREIGDRAKPIRSDIANLADLGALGRRVGQEHGRIDVLFQPERGQAGLFEQASEDEFTFDTKLKGTYFTAKNS